MVKSPLKTKKKNENCWNEKEGHTQKQIFSPLSLYNLLLFKNFVIPLFSASQSNFKAPVSRINAVSLRTYQ